MNERAVLYHRRFAHKKTTGSTIAKFYGKNGIRRKVLTKFKQGPADKLEEYKIW